MFWLENPPFFALYRTSCQRPYVALPKAVFGNEDTEIIFFEIRLESSQICPWKHQDKPCPPYRGEPRNHCKNEQLTDILGQVRSASPDKPLSVGAAATLGCVPAACRGPNRGENSVRFPGRVGSPEQ